MQKKEQEIYDALRVKHILDNIFVTKKKFFSGMSIKNIF